MTEFTEWVDVILADLHPKWQESGNPYYVWEAIDACAQHQRALPQWVLDYLAACATRMLSAEATQSYDFRKILPRVMGFPRKYGRGAHPLRPDDIGGAEYGLKILARIGIPPPAHMSGSYVYVFARAICRGAKPAAALRDAADALPRELSESDDKTIRSHIKKHFGLTNFPRTNAEWKRVILAWYAENRRHIADLTQNLGK